MIEFGKKEDGDIWRELQVPADIECIESQGWSTCYPDMKLTENIAGDLAPLPWGSNPHLLRGVGVGMI